MRSSTALTNSPLAPWLVLLLSTLLLGATALARAAVYTVGNTLSDPSCDHYTLREALASAAAQASGTAIIRIAWDTDTSLGYTYPNPDSAVEINDPQVGISIIGGYASCSASSPTAGQFTRLTHTNAPADHNHTMLAISNSTSNPHRYLDLINIRMEGAFDAGAGGPAFGGAVRVSGNAEVVLRNTRVSGFNATGGGGAVALIGSGTEASLFPQLYMFGNSYINENSANNGGGIYSLYGRVIINGSRVIYNDARLNGGGIHLIDREDTGGGGSDVNFALILDSGDDQNLINFNTAGTGAFSTTNGLGGGVYSRNGQILAKSDNAIPRFQSSVSSNTANLGGGIYLSGPNQSAGGPYTLLRIYNTSFSYNFSKGQGGALYLNNAVDGIISAVAGPCSVGAGTPTPSPCSYFGFNTAGGSDGAGVVPRGGAIYLNNTRADGASRAILRSYRTWFDDNADSAGLAAVAAAEGTSEMLFNRSIFTNNDARDSDGAASALVYTHTGTGLNFRYNTVLDSNTSSRMFNISGGTLDVTGSILWGTVNRTYPFHFVWFEAGGATMVHGACLLVRTSDSGTAGVPNAEFLWAGFAPDLDRRFAPRGNSAAIDHCDDVGGSPPPDAYAAGVYNAPGVEQRFGNFDLGAVEQNDIVFANGFGLRPGN